MLIENDDNLDEKRSEVSLKWTFTDFNHFKDTKEIRKNKESFVIRNILDYQLQKLVLDTKLLNPK